MTLPLVLSAAHLADALPPRSDDTRTHDTTSRDGVPQDPDLRLRIVDLRTPELYRAGHVPGAVQADAALLNRTDPPANGLLPELEMVNRLIADIGACTDESLVIYDGGGDTVAARMVWVLQACGIERCSWLDGGFPAWQAADGIVSIDTATPTPGDLRATVTGQYLIEADALLARLNDEDLAILDVRTRAEYEGTDVRAAMGGHVPGAVHQNWLDVLDERQQLRDPESLRSALADLGITPDKHVVVYCQSHQRSAVTFVLLRHLGFERVSALNGAWSLWGNRADLPKER